MQKCNTCHRAGGQLAKCGSFMTCPGGHDPVSPNFPQVDPTKDIVIGCATCQQTVAISAHDLLTGMARVDFKCARSQEFCEARVITPEAAAEEPKGSIKSPRFGKK